MHAVRIALTDRDAQEILTTAVESGACDYWGNVSDVERGEDGLVESFTIYDFEEGLHTKTVEEATHTVKAEQVEAACNKLLAPRTNPHTRRTSGEYYVNAPIRESIAMDDIDATAADCIVQMAVLGGVVYG